MDTLPKPTFDQAVQDLRYRDSFKVVLDALYHEREALFSEMEGCKDTDSIMQLSGKISQADKTIYLLTQTNDVRPAGCNGWMTVKCPQWIEKIIKRYEV